MVDFIVKRKKIRSETCSRISLTGCDTTRHDTTWHDTKRSRFRAIVERRERGGEGRREKNTRKESKRGEEEGREGGRHENDPRLAWKCIIPQRIGNVDVGWFHLRSFLPILRYNRELIDEPSRSHAVLGSLFTRYDITFLSLLLRKLSRIITREKITIYLISWIISVSSD